MSDIDDSQPDAEEVYELSGLFARAIAEHTASYDTATIMHALLDLAVNAGMIGGHSEAESLGLIKTAIDAALANAEA
ncbi:MAG: hypothetical protein QM667_13075 [Asticcacaulis sp.]